MPKIMAVLDSGAVVTNIIWCDENVAETDTLKNTNNLPITFGDTYKDGGFYRGNAEIKTTIYSMTVEMCDMHDALNLLLEDENDLS